MTVDDKKSEGAAIQLLNQAALGYIVSAALNVALGLAIADRLADGPRSTADLAKDAGVHEDSLYRVLRALASAGIFEERGPRTFALNLVAASARPRSSHRSSNTPASSWRVSCLPNRHCA